MGAAVRCAGPPRAVRALISVIIPTVTGREAYLARCEAAYGSLPGVELIVIRDRPTCGVAWQEGARLATGDYLHWTADDLIPHDGWADAASDTINRGAIPGAVVYNPDGSLQTCGGGTELVADLAPVPHYTAVPFCSRWQWARIGPHQPWHYYTDNWFSHRAQRAGIPILSRDGYAFTHYTAQVGRGAGMTEGDRMDHDRALFERAVGV